MAEAGAAARVLNEGIAELLQGKSVEAYNHHFIESQGASSIVHRMTGVEMLVVLDPENKEHHLAPFLNDPSAAAFDIKQASLKECEKVHRMLLSPVLHAPDVAQKWKKVCAERFPRSSYFEGRDMTHLTMTPEQANAKGEGMPDSPKAL